MARRSAWRRWTGGGAGARCASPVFRGGVSDPRLRHAAASSSRARPAQRADRARRAGVRAFPCESGCVGPWRDADAGAPFAPGPRCSPPARRARACRALRSRLTVASSHIVLTEPVPDVLEELGWTGGECITDGRTLVHYFRTTRDGRIVFGWGGGGLAFGARLNGRAEVDPDVPGRFAPACCASSRPYPGAGSPTPGAARSTSRRATSRRSAPCRARRVHYAFGYTGNGVWPVEPGRATLAALAPAAGDEVTALPIVDSGAGRVGPAGAARMAGRLARAPRARAPRADRGAGRARRPAHPGGLRRPARGRDPPGSLVVAGVAHRAAAVRALAAAAPFAELKGSRRITCATLLLSFDSKIRFFGSAMCA